MLSVLNAVQDFVSEDLREPWPTDVELADRPALPPHQLPLAHVERIPDAFRLVYGDPAQPALELPPLRDVEIERREPEGQPGQ